MPKGSVRNRLLAALPVEDFEAFRPKLERVKLRKRQILQHRHLPMQYAYFIETGAASLLTGTRDDGEIEVGIIGPNGFVGLSVVLGTASPSNRCVVQLPGQAWRIGSDDLRQMMERSTALQKLLLAYVQAALAQRSQMILCNMRHSLEQRLARWILTSRDCAEGDDLPLTHAILAKMLGTRRPGVTEALGRLEAGGVLEKHRGWITIIDRNRLERLTCGCYDLIRAEYNRLIPQSRS